MKTSYKILTAIGLISIILVFLGLIQMRNALQENFSNSTMEKQYKIVPITRFTNVDFSDHWDVRILQGKEYKVELAVLENTKLKPKLANKDGTLYFQTEPTQDTATTHHLHARVTVPFLHTVKAVRGTTINMINFESDSLQIILKDGGTFIGTAAHFQKLAIQTSGNSTLQFIKEIQFKNY